MALEAIEACSGVVHPVDLEVNTARSWANSRSKRGRIAGGFEALMTHGGDEVEEHVDTAVLRRST